MDEMNKIAQLLHEVRSSMGEFNSYKDLNESLPQDIELMQALVLFLANQPSVDFLLPYFCREITAEELEILVSRCLDREDNYFYHWLKAEETLAEFKRYEILRQRKYIVELESAIAKRFKDGK